MEPAAARQPSFGDPPQLKRDYPPLYSRKGAFSLYRPINGFKVQSVVEIVLLQFSLSFDVNIVNDEKFFIKMGPLKERHA